MKENLVRLIKEVLAEDGVIIRGVYERSDAKEREKEGMEKRKGFIGPEFDTEVEIVENGVRYEVDVERRPEDRLLPGSEIQPSGYPALWRKTRRCWTALPIPVPLP